MHKFRELRNKVASEIRRAKRHYYVMNIGRQNTNGDARMWWKKVWKLTGKKKSSINLSKQGSDSKLEDKDAANMINTFFADLTNDFPEIQSRWSSYGHSDVLPTVTPESVAKKLFSIQSNKAPGPNDPYLKIINMFAHFFIPQYRYYQEVLLLFAISCTSHIKNNVLYSLYQDVSLFLRKHKNT